MLRRPPQKKQMVTMSRLSYVADSIQGKHRAVNKDRYGIFTRNNGSEYLIVVFDGVSSAPNAKHGVRMAYNVIEKEFQKNFVKHDDLKNIIYSASEKLRLSKYDKPYTTVCAMYVNLTDQPWVKFCSLGDTRGYVVSPTSIKKITTDHISEYANNILTHYVGMENIRKEDIFLSEKITGNTFLLCTDGFYSLMEKSITVFHEFFTDIKVHDFSKRMQNMIKNYNDDDATYVLVRIDHV